MKSAICLQLQGQFSITPGDGRVWIQSGQHKEEILEMISSLFISLQRTLDRREDLDKVNEINKELMNMVWNQ